MSVPVQWANMPEWMRQVANALNGLLKTTVGDVYTPTLYNTTNIDASTAHECYYQRIGQIVHVFGRVDIDPTTAASGLLLGVSLPIASNFTSTYDCSGTVAGLPSGYTQAAGTIRADTTNDRAQIEFVAPVNTNTTYMFSFGYRIIS